MQPNIKRVMHTRIASAILVLVATSAVAITEFDDGGGGDLSSRVNAASWQGLTLPQVNIICSAACRIEAGASGAYTLVVSGSLGPFSRLAGSEDLLIARMEAVELVLKHEKTTPDLRCNSGAKAAREAGDTRFAVTSGDSLTKRVSAAIALYQMIAAQDYIPGIPGGGHGAIRTMLTSQILGIYEGKPVFMFPMTYADGVMERFVVRPEDMFSDLPLSISSDYNSGTMLPEVAFGGGTPQGCPSGGGGVTG